MLVVGILLGGNVLLCYLGEYGIDVCYVSVVVMVFVLLDMWVGGVVLFKGFNMVYMCMFLCMFKVKVNVKFD